jgi:hypothetical protein
VEIVDGELRIRIGVQTLAFAAENPPGRGLWDDGQQVSVLNADEWAEDVRRELLRDEEDGTTELHLLLDSAMRQACENGSAAVSVTDADTDPDEEEEHNATLQGCERSEHTLQGVVRHSDSGGEA